MARAFLPIPTPTLNDLKRFWLKIEIAGPDDCWLWRGKSGTKINGTKKYPTFAFAGKYYPCNRISYAFTFAIDPETNWVLHKCDNPRCANPNHFFLGDALTNTLDMLAKGRGGKCDLSGANNGRAILDEAKVYEIRQRRASGEPLAELAKEFNVTKQTIWAIHHRKLWGYLPESA